MDDLVQRLRGYAQADDLLPSERDDLLTAADALARKDAEIAELRKEVAGWRRQAVQRSEDWREQYARAERAEARVRELEAGVSLMQTSLESAHASLTALDARVREAPVVTMPQGYAHLEISFNGEFADRYYGKRVALVLLDTEEGK